MPEKLTLQIFKEKIFDYETGEKWAYKGTAPAIVDFYADWCGPCRMVAPILDNISKKYGQKLTVYKVDTEAEPELSGLFGIQSIPSLLFIPVDGEPRMLAGALPEKEFDKIIADVLKVSP
ncbi:MAG: thioredoxin [Spirochaetes bacterium GWD1_61_31]|nr:MAG: thioredoxin [Spirochaetes bacterium GWB1_60_80]OHD30101.1 MAG: thioredoxin [Spirochaetes bacterium GWC1_61_12]OHD34648.1 MAG: thioredoxin [Spirochaetes bacterium GWD1_61_31]OHD46464.1 MAG: thioredoxin [Spirochaetes bacterium GWE1_60_18]OHD59519.1 MAG: thioredoxin [Spirochaetes bacterium GWF1_60_12]HAW85784.1 thioredoxin [Spirochaetaceae bacterium]